VKVCEAPAAIVVGGVGETVGAGDDPGVFRDETPVTVTAAAPVFVTVKLKVAVNPEAVPLSATTPQVALDDTEQILKSCNTKS
jgi:hypothetical protein